MAQQLKINVADDYISELRAANKFLVIGATLLSIGAPATREDPGEALITGAIAQQRALYVTNMQILNRPPWLYSKLPLAKQEEVRYEVEQYQFALQLYRAARRANAG